MEWEPIFHDFTFGESERREMDRDGHYAVVRGICLSQSRFAVKCAVDIGRIRKTPHSRCRGTVEPLLTRKEKHEHLTLAAFSGI